jgi:hypothetical protein
MRIRRPIADPHQYFDSPCNIWLRHDSIASKNDSAIAHTPHREPRIFLDPEG